MRLIRKAPSIAAAVLAIAGCGGSDAPVVMAPAAFALTDASCAALATASALPDKTAAWVPAAGILPEHCVFEGSIATGDNLAGFNTVKFQLKLPTSWNQKFYMAGGGGFAGSFSNTNSALAAGYAAASTSAGHTGSSLDASWALNNRQALIDFGYRGVEVSTTQAKAIVAAYYGKPLAHSYFEGCSSGGRQALMQIQRVPNSYDGVIAGHPAIKTGTAGVFLHTWVQQALLANPLPVEKVAVLTNAVNASCDAIDGIVDRILDDPRKCNFDPAVLQCPGNIDGPGCLTTGQIQTVKTIYRGPHSNGQPLMKGILPGAEADGTAGWDYWYLNGLPAFGLAPIGFTFQEQELKYFYFNDPNYDWKTFNFDVDAPLIQSLNPILHATNPDLSGFRANGGKLIMYQGYNDPTVPALETIDYYENIVSFSGSTAAAEGFARLFMMPGVQHCGSSGSPGPNTLVALRSLEDWVERGIAPDRILATHSTAGVVDIERPLCPYPRVARRIDPAGSSTVASNFACVMP